MSAPSGAPGSTTHGAVAPVATIVLAKAPVPGRVKTRLCPPATAEQAATLAAAALLDTLDAVRATPGAHPVVSFTGERSDAVLADELHTVLDAVDVVEQRGDSLGERIAAAHADTAALHPGLPTLQVGMDTPQLSAALLEQCVHTLLTPGNDAVLGLATDGGWWILGLRDPHRAAVLADVPMSREDTGARTLDALRAAGLQVGVVAELTDVDTAAEAVEVAALIPGSRFAASVDACASALTAGSPA
ncbi:DUF2064 domain-containing protein [Pseudonocardia sp. KRD291]|uniref:TIGR04282 family arsenosugar biosynthesis glycosyltransferase n=1 Tax=Pseudonocardia sp. KRD291 TaxID=2792007 RepID=UPI001C4A7487|nr:DUF2064 domain-containing protein [Pseudonocardia sp. KRD291]MBW0105442.1 DUF2064 domain-containing protein [Pseudonocardia sp. KRD291]